MQRAIESASTIDRLSSRPDGWRRAHWGSGAFETAYRPMTSIVEGRILSSNHLIMATLSGGAERHEISADGGIDMTAPIYRRVFHFSRPAASGGFGCTMWLGDGQLSRSIPPRSQELLAYRSKHWGPCQGWKTPLSGTSLRSSSEFDALEGGLDAIYCDTMSLALVLYLARRYGGARVSDASITLPAWRLRRVTEFIDAHLSRDHSDCRSRSTCAALGRPFSPRVQGSDWTDSAAIRPRAACRDGKTAAGKQ